MGILINGNKPSNIIYNGAESSLYFNGHKIWPEGGDPYNPLNLPPNTVRVRTSDGNPPIKDGATSYVTATLVQGTSDVYDLYNTGTSFRYFLHMSTNVVEVLGANTTGITDMHNMFYKCTSLTSVALFDTSSVTDMGDMFNQCNSLTTVPLFDTSNVTDMGAMFYDCIFLTSIPLFNTLSVTDMYQTFYMCRRVESGALALYQQASTQTTPPAVHTMAFFHCGEYTTNGAAELAQIPSGWK